MQLDIFNNLFHIPDVLQPFSFVEWLSIFLFMIFGITIAILTRYKDITLPSRIGNKIRIGTIGQYVIIFCLSFFFQSFGYTPIAAGFYAGSIGTVANYGQKVFKGKASLGEIQEKVDEVTHELDEYKKYNEEVSKEKDEKVFNIILDLLTKVPKDVCLAAVRTLGLNIDEKTINLGIEAVKEIETSAKMKLNIPVDKDPEREVEVGVAELRKVLKGATKKSLFKELLNK